MIRKELHNPEGTVVYYSSDSFSPQKDTIFFLHGLTASHLMFEDQISFFKDQYNVIAWDAPAHGESRPYKPFTYEHAALCMKAILDECKVEEVILCGQSMGGFFAQSFIRRFPHMAKAFIAIDSTPYGDYYSESDKWWLRQIEWMAMLFPGKTLQSSMALNAAMTEKGRVNMMEMTSVYTKRELCHLMYVGYAGFLEDNEPLKIERPVLLILGEHDITGKVKTYNLAWAERTGFPLVIVPGAAHNSNVDNPEFVSRVMQRFLERI